MPRAATRSGSSEPDRRVVPESLRSQLAARYGPVLSGKEAESRIRSLTLFASCGDRVTADAIRLGNLPHLGIVDLKTRRNEPVDASAFAPLAARDHRRVRNPPGELTTQLRRTVRAMVEGRGGLLEVEGEEDLGALALVESLPVGATVIYGIPGEGVSFVTVDADAKARVQALLRAMEPGTGTDGD